MVKQWFQYRAQRNFGWVRQANESFALFEEGQHTQYPDKGFRCNLRLQSQNASLHLAVQQQAVLFKMTT